MKTAVILLSCLSLIAAAEESYFFTYAGGFGNSKKTVKGDRLHTVRQIERIETPKAVRIFAFHQGLGRGREYQIQIDLAANVKQRWHPHLKLGEDVITSGISVGYSNNKDFPSTLMVGSDDPEKIKKWTGILVDLMQIPEEDVHIDLAKREQGGDQAVEGEPENDNISVDTKWRLKGETEWQLNDGPLVAIQESKEEGMSLHDKDGKMLFKLDKGTSLRQAVLSSQQETLMFNIGNDDGFGGHLLRVSMDGDQPKFEQVFSYPATPLFEGDRWWISELGAVSDDGNTVLVELGWQSPKRSWVSYEWQTWSIGDKRCLGRGLHVIHGKINGAEQDGAE